MADGKKELDHIERKVMSGLKDFQRATVERIAGLYQDGQLRILVSDEVGLGKTLIARGVIVKLAQMRKAQKDNLVRVVYVCSNGAIADQNLEKLMIGSNVRRESANTSRLSMQHLNIFMQESDPELLQQYVQLIPLTPETSFRVTTGAGSAAERALMYAILRRLPQMKGWERQLEVAMMDQATSSWPQLRDEYERQVQSCDLRTHGKYLSYMRSRLEQALLKEREDGATYLEQLTALFSAIRRNYNSRVKENKIIGKLRIVFAKISLDKLEPDLVIMDEFQRFKYLLSSDETSDTGMLAKRFFHSDHVRMLLLSATPYKMYSTLEEIDDTQVDEHYSEFMEVMRFLNTSEQENEKFKTVWNDYSVRLKELTRGNTTFLQAKQAAEDSLYAHICRTERSSAPEGTDLIDAHEVKQPLRVEPRDISSYLQAQKLLDEIGMPCHVPVDYVKSCPYLMSFMQNYKLKTGIEHYFKNHPEEVRKAGGQSLWLKKADFQNYGPIEPGNARLAEVLRLVFQDHAENLLWVPPCRPYYTPAGAFQGIEHFSKTLIFSSWEMVPRMLACMLSYEAERRSTGLLAAKDSEKEAQYFHPVNKRYPPSRLDFALGHDKKPATMNLLCLLYPSQFLAGCYDPLDCMNRDLSLEEIRTEVKGKIRERLLKKCPYYGQITSGQVDQRWYYLAPLLLDSPSYARNWINEAKSLTEQENENVRRNFRTHLELLQGEYTGQVRLGRAPEALLEFLTTLAIASPAVCAYRTYCSYGRLGYGQKYWPSMAAWTFLSRMNTPESTAVVECCFADSLIPHWMKVLHYCQDGNLQAVFDEYAHLLTNGMERNEHLLERLHDSMINSIKLQTSTYRIDTYHGFSRRVRRGQDEKIPLRSHFAVSFQKGEEEKTVNRKKAVRNAFNSPFRPFVLASTSIGQEGLDFHNYCRRIVHWNLPSNPIDLEQREGRINRFECLAIRQNVAKRYGAIPFQKDIWNEMFAEAARREKTEGASDLIPFWGLRETEDMVRIERIVPMYPFSRDELSYERLIKILSLYRLTLGQARQEELLEYIFQNVENPDELKNLFINLSPFYKK